MGSKINLNKDNKFGNLLDYKEYYLIKEESVYNFLICKRSNDIIIKCQKYEVILNNNDLSKLTNSILIQ